MLHGLIFEYHWLSVPFFLNILPSLHLFLHQEQMLGDAITLLDTHRRPLSQPSDQTNGLWVLLKCYAVLCQVEVLNLENHSLRCSTRIYQIPLNTLKEGYCPGFLQDRSLLVRLLSLAFRGTGHCHRSASHSTDQSTGKGLCNAIMCVHGGAVLWESAIG